MSQPSLSFRCPIFIASSPWISSSVCHIGLHHHAFTSPFYSRRPRMSCRPSIRTITFARCKPRMPPSLPALPWAAKTSRSLRSLACSFLLRYPPHLCCCTSLCRIMYNDTEVSAVSWQVACLEVRPHLLPKTNDFLSLPPILARSPTQYHPYHRGRGQRTLFTSSSQEGGTLTAARALCSRRCRTAIWWGGGRHHAQAAKASG